jgi:lipopolysaccharide transport system ATP-binding protein
VQDVSFEIRKGQVVGIIGRNGAGKSTLLKILSRITEPTQGRAEVRGRVRSLLEVGTGFHPELTGRENIFLNGAILGMSRAEIARKFDEIVAVSEVEKFLDTPVKHYSSGMYVRLAFSVAAHLEPEILLVDEVLAVGDAAFQKKCLGKIGDVAHAGRTVLFVSHNMNAIRRLCETAFWLDEGKIRSQGPVARTVGDYEGAVLSPTARSLGSETGFMSWSLERPEASDPHSLTTMGPITLRFDLRVLKPVIDGIHGIALRDEQNLLIWAWAAYHVSLPAGLHSFLYRLPSLPLRPGAYQWHVSLSDSGTTIDEWYGSPAMVVSTEPLGHPNEEWSGILNIPCDFSVRT